MVYENIIYRKEEGIARITINRPDVMNALNPAVLMEITAALREAWKSEDAGVVVLTGAGRAFTAGIDLKSLGKRRLEGGSIGSILDDPGRELINTIQSIPRVVIAMVNGYCITGGLEIALGCDLIIASEEARFADTHVRWGVRPSWGMSQRLPRAVGLMKAKELSFTADMISGKEAERIGLINKAVPAEKLEETVRELAMKILSNSRDTIAAIKYLYNRGMADTLENGLEMEARSEFVISDTGERLRSFLKKDGSGSGS